LNLTQRLIVGSLLVCGVFVVLTVACVDWRLRNRLREESVAELLREARLVGMQWRPGINADSLADAAGAALSHRVTLVAPNGVVLGDSEFDEPALSRLQNHATRPEISSALRSDTGSSIRTSPSAGDEEMYAAVRTTMGVARVSLGTQAQEAIVARLQRDVLAVALGATLLALLLSVVIARSISRPVLELRDDAKAIAAGDLERRPALNVSGEVGELATAFHQVAEQLSTRLRALEADDALLRALMDSLNEGAIALDSRQQVVHLNARARRLLGVRDEVPFPSDRLPRERVLRSAIAAALSGEAIDALELTLHNRTVTLTARPLASGGAVLALFDLTPLRRLETVRSDFVANVSHELKTPLTVVGGFAETLGDEALEPEMRRQFASAILANTRRMQRIVDDLLDLSRIESGGWTPNPAPVDIESVAEEVMAGMKSRGSAKGIALRVDVEPPSMAVEADPTAIRQVLANLVDNAVRHTTAGEVVVQARPSNGGVTVAVRDTGSGIRAEHLARIFERFYRVDSARSRDEGGTGLGLAIVKHLVEAHGGRVTAASELDRGTTIEAWFPQPAVPSNGKV
jgi:two-component system, OmpR family, phosphate regulon sensor histidine kinase PhoR